MTIVNLILKLIELLNPWSSKRRLDRRKSRAKDLLIPSVNAFLCCLTDAQDAVTNFRGVEKNYHRLLKRCLDKNLTEQQRIEAIEERDRIHTWLELNTNSTHGIDLSSETAALQLALFKFRKQLFSYTLPEDEEKE